MQASGLKKVLFFFVLGLSYAQRINAQAEPEWFARGDSLFAAGRFQAAHLAYDRGLSERKLSAPAVYLKLAYVAEQADDALRAQYYLNQYFERQPNEAVLARLSEQARANGWEGYELNDFNVLILLYKQYARYLVGILLVLAAYIFVVLIIKRAKRQYIPSRHLIIFIVYLLGIGVLVNVPETYRQAVVNRDAVLLRQEASNGAPIAYQIDRGHRLNVLSQSDIWLGVIWNNELVFVKENDVWLIN